MASQIQTEGVDFKRLGIAVSLAALVGYGLYSLTRDEPAAPTHVDRVRAAPQTQQIVPTYGKTAAPTVERAAMLSPSLPTGDTAGQKPQGQRRPGRPKEKTYEQKLWEEHLAAGVGGDEFPQDASQAAPAGGSAASGYAPGGGCVLAPTVPVVMQIESAGYTERGGMINGLIVQPALGLGMGCTVLPAGSRVSMEFWGEIGESEMVEIGFPTFLVPGKGAIQPRPITGAPEPAKNLELPDHLSGWVTTPTLSLDSGDMVTLQLRGELNANR